MNKVFPIFLFLFVFNTFNREFTPFIDIRFVLILVSMALIISILFKNKVSFKGINIKNEVQGLKEDKPWSHYLNPLNVKANSFIKYLFISFLSFYFIIFLSNLSWFNNPFEIKGDFINLNILYGYNLLAIVTLFLYKREIQARSIYLFALFSGFFLFISMILTLLGVDIHAPFNHDARSYNIEEKSILAPLGIRVGGYAEDANYASLCMITWFITTYLFSKNKSVKIGVLVLALIGFFISFSKTLLLAIILIVLILFINRIIKKIHILQLILILGAFVPIVLIKVKFLDALSTMSIRYSMWRHGLDLFLSSPIFGSGVSSFRSYFEYSGGWYVHPHSSFITLLSENGIFTALIFVYILLLLSTIKNNLYLVMLLSFFFLSITSDLMPYPYLVYILFLIPLTLHNSYRNYFPER